MKRGRRKQAVRLGGVPTAVRYCKRCNRKTEFVSSGCFRVNAHKKKLDIWLVYNCSVCKTNWNLTILSGVSPQSIPRDKLILFHDNDSSLAMHYAADITLLKRNGAEPGQMGNTKT